MEALGETERRLRSPADTDSHVSLMSGLVGWWAKYLHAVVGCG